MKTYIVTVERLTCEDKVYHTEHYKIMAHLPEEAHAIVHNQMELTYEPYFRIVSVEELK